MIGRVATAMVKTTPFWRVPLFLRRVYRTRAIAFRVVVTGDRASGFRGR